MTIKRFEPEERFPRVESASPASIRASQKAIARRSNKLQEAQRQLLVSQMYMSGHMTMEQIADRLTAMGYANVRKSDVSRDINALEKKWIEAAEINVDMVMKKELIKLDLLEQEAFECLRAFPDDLKREGYMDQILRIHDRRIKLLGLDKRKVEISGPGGRPLSARIVELRDEDLEAIIAGSAASNVLLSPERTGTALATVPATVAAMQAMNEAKVLPPLEEPEPRPVGSTIMRFQREDR